MVLSGSILTNTPSSWHKLRFKEAKALTQKKTTGLRLRLAGDSRKNTGWLPRLMISLAGSAALILTMAGLAGFRFGSTLLIMLLTGGLFCGIYAFLERLGRRHWFAPGLLAAALLLTLIFRQQALEGWRLYRNQLSLAVTEGTGWILPQLETQLPDDAKALSISVFAVLTAGGIAWSPCPPARTISRMPATSSSGGW